MQVDPCQSTRRLRMRAQHLAEGLVAPGRRLAAEEQAVFELVLPSGNGSLVGRHAVRRDPRVDGFLVVRCRWPGGWQQQRVQFGVGRIHRQRLRVVGEVAVQVDVLVGDAPSVRKAVRVQRMNIKHGDAGCARLVAPLVVVQREHLHAAAAMAFDAVACAGDHEQLLCIGCPVERDVHRDLFAFTALERMHMRIDRQASRGASLQELGTRDRIGRGKGFDNPDHAMLRALRNCSASSTQQVAPRGIKSSLKS